MSQLCRGLCRDQSQNVSRDTLCTYQYVFVCVCVCAQAVDYASNNFIIGSSECSERTLRRDIEKGDFLTWTRDSGKYGSLQNTSVALKASCLQTIYIFYCSSSISFECIYRKTPVGHFSLCIMWNNF